MIKKLVILFLLLPFVASASEIALNKQADADFVEELERHKGHYKVGSKYTIKGVEYTPSIQPSYKKDGIASWYGPGFHGKDTANVEVYDQNAMTAAHKTLPLPSVVRVTNLENGRSVIVRVNDRGPYADDRIIDMSLKGANKLGFHDNGTARVRVELLQAESLAAVATKSKIELPEEWQQKLKYANKVDLHPKYKRSDKPKIVYAIKPSPSKKYRKSRSKSKSSPKIINVSKALKYPRRKITATKDNIYIYLGKYRDSINANVAAKDVKGLGGLRVSKMKGGYKVMVGPFDSYNRASGVLQKVHDRGYIDATILAVR